MQCPKCKSHISDNALRCQNCNLKVRIVCPKCKTINLMGKKKCKNCGYEIFIKCPTCSAINLSESDYCRKCGDILSPIKKEEKIELKKIYTDNETNKNEIRRKQNIKEIKIQADVEEIPSEENKDKTQNAEINNQSYKDNSNNEAETEVTEKSKDSNVEQYKEQDLLISSEDIDISQEQLKTLFDTVEEIEKNHERKKETEELIQQKFEKHEETINENEAEIPLEYVKLNQNDSQQAIIEAIQNPMTRIISLNGKEGYGKTLILKYAREALRDQNYVWAWGECNALTQITPFGYIQDVLLNLFNLSNFCVNIENFVKNNVKALEAQFFNLNPEEIDDLFNLLYPVKTSEFNGILKRKEYTTNIIKKVFENMTIKSTVIFVIDDFESIDGASYDFLKNIIEDEKINEKIKILLTNKYNKIAQGYFYDKALTHNNYSNIFLSGLDKNQCMKLVNTLYGADIDFPQGVKEQICENSKGASVYVEQACLLLNEIGAITQNDSGEIIFNNDFDNYILPKNTYRIIEERMSILDKNNPLLVNALYYACLLGNKFSVHQFENVLQFLKISKEDFKQICNYLISTNYLTPMSENYLTFNNTSIWHYIYERAKTDDKYVEYNNNIYACVQYLTLSNNSLKPLLLQNSNNKQEAYALWKNNAELSAYLGDTNLYVISLKQMIKLADDISGLMSAKERIIILERMGKILYKLNSKEAVSYLSASIAYYKEKENYNPVRIVELSSFLVQACSKFEDFHGVIETCDEAINALEDGQYLIERTLITSKKLKALLQLGNCEEIINLARTELMEVMENALAKSNTSNIVSDDIIFDAWVDTCMNLAYAYALKGDIRVFDILSKLDDAIKINKIIDSSYVQQIMLIKSFNHTMRGEIKLSSDLLTQIKSKYSTEDMDEIFILRWNFINIINKIISMDYNNIADEMFQVATFADNINDGFTKNMLKLLLGYVIQVKSKNTVKAIDIYNDEIVYFSKEKIATGALLCWLLISNASINSKGVDFALDIALKALDVAKGPKVYNYIFIIALKRLIAHIYMIKHDYEAAKMYLEKAMSIAQQNDLKFLQMLIYKSFAKYSEELISLNQEETAIYVNKTIEMYKKAINICQILYLNEQEAAVIKDFTAFKVSCQLKNIPIVEQD